MASLTYYLLRKKGSAVGDGPYLACDAQGEMAMVPDHQQGKRFLAIGEAEIEAKTLVPQMGEFEIEVRNIEA